MTWTLVVSICLPLSSVAKQILPQRERERKRGSGREAEKVREEWRH